ncbi:hypothetical protein [Xanthomonas arboricola]
MPTVLLIYNTVDPFQLFVTERHDFISAMYGELTVRIDMCGNAASDFFHGRNATLRENANTSFSGVGHLRETRSGAEVIIYEIVFAAHAVRRHTRLHHGRSRGTQSDRLTPRGQVELRRSAPGRDGRSRESFVAPRCAPTARKIRPQTHPAVRA